MVPSDPTRLERDYADLCRSTGAAHLVRRADHHEAARFDRYILAELAESAAEQEQVYVAPDGLQQSLVRHRADRFLGLSMVRDYATTLDAATETLGLRIGEPYLAGVYPTDSFNAQAKRLESGLLLAIDHGLMMLAYQAIKILSWAWVVRPENGGVGMTFPRPERIASRTRRAQTKALQHLFAAYLIEGDVTRAPRYAALAGPVGDVSVHLTAAIETFALAHEYGHAICGHLSRAETGRDDSAYLTKSRADEFEADLVGFRLLLASSDAAVGAQGWPLMTLVAAPLLFFALDGSIEGLRERFPEARHRPQDHPPSTERLEALTQHALADPRVTEETLSMSQAYVACLDAAVDAISELKLGPRLAPNAHGYVRAPSPRMQVSTATSRWRPPPGSRSTT